MSTRARALLVGAIAFAATFVLIVGGAIAFVLVRGGHTDPVHPTGRTTASTTMPSTDSSASTNPGASPTDPAQFCWFDPSGRVSTNPAGKLVGGGLQLTLPDGYSEGQTNGTGFIPALGDPGEAISEVEGNWVSALIIGKVAWQPGFSYPGAQKVSQRVIDCYTGTNGDSGPWKPSVTKFHLENATTQAVEVGGMKGYRTDVSVVFDQTKLTSTKGSDLTSIVLDGPHGPVMFFSEVPTGDATRAQAREQAIQTLVAV